MEHNTPTFFKVWFVLVAVLGVVAFGFLGYLLWLLVTWAVTK